jgi:hypothetical protein
MPTPCTADGSAKAAQDLAQVPPFCVDQLPKWLRDYTGELSLRYTVPQSDLALACIATVGTIAGSRAKVGLGWGAQANGSNLLVVLKPEENSNLGFAMQHIVAPVVARQIEILNRRREFNDFKLERKLELRSHKMAFAYVSDEGLRQYLEEPGNLLRTAKPALLLGRLDRETLLRALSQSVDGRLFMCNELAFEGHPCPAEGDSKLDLELVQRCLNRLPITESFGRAEVNISEPSLGGVLVATPLGFASWFTQFESSPVVGSSLLLLRSPAKQAVIDNPALEALSLQNEWCMRMDHLMDGWNPEAVPYQISRKAKVKLFCFHNDLIRSTSKLPQPAIHVYRAPYQLAIRLMVGLNLLETGSLQISSETAETAVNLARHYGRRQLCTWMDAHADTTASRDAQSKLLRLHAA